ncbi:MAG: FAD-binding oxidoreductase [Candidatus Promineifilaceae bacterium]|nr:FAD-binding oxidoreductase [Candidatus Promineifilaceae bacterium]
MENNYDVILVGGGVMGCAIAYNLLKGDSWLRVAILEMDATYKHNSTVLSDGNHRVQFNLKENIEISLYGLEVLDRSAEEMGVDDQQPDIAFRREGNLFLVDAKAQGEAEAGLALQQRLGCRVEWLTPAEIRTRFPLIEPGECVGATFGPDDGTMDPQAVLVGYRNKAVDLGATFLEVEVASVETGNERVTGVTLATSQRLNAPVVVNSAGAWAARLASTVGIDLPVQPVKRQVFVLETAARPETTMPLVLLPSGQYLIHEHQGHFMCGKSLEDDPVAFEFTWDKRLFEERLWPELVQYAPTFDRLKVVSGWAGLYAVNTFDGNAILGQWPDLAGFYLANGFSGHGFQQCHAVGRYLAELILDRPPTLDLSIFSPDRILADRPVLESARRLI